MIQKKRYFLDMFDEGIISSSTFRGFSIVEKNIVEILTQSLINLAKENLNAKSQE